MVSHLLEVLAHSIESITSSVGYFFAVAGGALSTELIRYIDSRRRVKMDFLKVLVSSFVGTVVVLALQPYLADRHFSEGVIRLLAVILGCMGYKLAKMWDSPEGVFGCIERWIKILYLAKDLSAKPELIEKREETPMEQEPPVYNRRATDKKE